jgi:predicted RNA methylase
MSPPDDLLSAALEAIPFGGRYFDECLESDLDFDNIYDDRIRALSAQHWTPVAVAARAATLLTQAGATRILDIGSGVGKFCIVGALATGAEFVGVERREELVAVARAAAWGLGTPRATFVHASIDAFSLAGFNGIYLYNPFFEQISRALPLIDETMARSRETYRFFVRATLAKLSALPTPAAIVTYSGFGARLPPEFRLTREEAAGTDRLELWLK